MAVNAATPPTSYATVTSPSKDVSASDSSTCVQYWHAP